MSVNSNTVNGDLVAAGTEMALQSATTPDEVKKEIARLRSTNALYDLYAPEWAFYLAAYEGGKSFTNESNIFRYPREHEDDWRERLKRAHYHNYCERLVDFFTDFIYCETIDRNGGEGNDFFGQFITNVNRKGEDLDSFMRQVSDDMQIFGMSYVLVDAPKAPVGTPVSKADEARLNLKPYWVLIKPLEILDWITDEFDKFLYVKRCQTMTLMDGPDRRVVERYTEFFPDHTSVKDVDITDKSKPRIIDRGSVKNSLGEISIEVSRYKRSKQDRFMGTSFLRDIAYNNREVMNVTSMEQEFLYKQCFNVMAMERDSTQELQDQQDGEWGLSNVIYYPQGGSAPTYIRPDSKPAEHMMKYRQDCVNEMYKRAAQDMVNELFNGGKSSGYSKSMSFSTTVPYIASRASTLENLEGRLFQRTFRFVKQTWKGKVKYKDRYEITNLTDAITQLGTLFKDLQMPSETFVKAELKRLVHEFDGKIPYEEMQKIESEIDSFNFEEWSDTQKLAYIGRAAMAPEAASALGNPDGKADTASASNPARPTPTTSTVTAQATKTRKPQNQKR
jgi:hypothetical protein